MVHGPEEGLVAKATLLVEVRAAVGYLEMAGVASHVVVGGGLEHAVPLQDVVEAAFVPWVVVAGTPATGGVADELPVLLGLREVLEHNFWAPFAVAVKVVGKVEDVFVGDVVDVFGVESHHQEAAGDALVPELEGVDLEGGVEHRRGEDLLHHAWRQRFGAFRGVLPPAWFVPQAVEEVEHACVVLSMVIVDRRSPRSGQYVVQPLLALEYVRLLAVLPAPQDEDLHVVVVDVLLGRYGVAHDGCPLEDVVATLEAPRVV